MHGCGLCRAQEWLGSFGSLCVCLENDPAHNPAMRIFPIVTLTLVLSFTSAARESTLLDSGWRFQSGDTTNAQDAIFDDSSWPAVTIPHNWGWEQAQQGNDFY